MKKIYVSILFCLLCTGLHAEGKVSEQVISSKDAFNRFSIGVRGGVASYTASGEYKSQLGVNFHADFQYLHFFSRKTRTSPFLGISTGLSFGFQSGGVEGPYSYQYSTTDASGDEVDYTITAGSIKQVTNEVQMQVPLMFSLFHNGLYFNVGPKMVVPLYSRCNQTVSDAHITAYYVPYGVTITDKVITGKMPDDQVTTAFTGGNAKLKLFLYAEIGYEFMLKSKNSIGLGAYFDYNVYSLKKADASTSQCAISISQIGADPYDPAPKVSVNPVTSGYAGEAGSFNVGLKVSFNFNYF